MPPVRYRASRRDVLRWACGAAAFRLLLIGLLAAVASSCASGTTSPSAPVPDPSQASTPLPSPAPAPAPIPAADEVWDLDGRGVPRFVTRSYLDVGVIASISRFRSGAGHSYTDDVETCRSMKHYVRPIGGLDWSAIAIISPVDGTVVRRIDEWAGTQLHIEARDSPAFHVILFHVQPSIVLSEGTRLQAGQIIGSHVGNQTYSDVAVSVATPQGTRLVSWFEVLDDGAFAAYAARGLTSRAEAGISRAERDAHPLACSGESFAGPGDLENWVNLR